MLRTLSSFLLLASTLTALSACRTAEQPAQASREPVDVIAFGSCARQNQPQPIWGPISAQDPDLFLFIGDNIYADTEDMTVMRAKYAELGAKPGFRQLRASTPILATWDDHDFGVNDGGREYPAKERSQREFLDFFRIPSSSPLRERPGVYDAHVYGPKGRQVQIILLDTRYFRSPLERWPEGERPEGLGPFRPIGDSSATMLGEAQWAWLEEQLRQPADVRIIASSIQFIPEEHGYEMWANMPLERGRMLDLIRDTGAEGVIFISGDRHLAEISRIEADAPDGVGYDLYDVTSSGLTQDETGPVNEPNRHRISPNYRGTNFGVLRIDWRHPEPQVRMQIHGQDGQVLFEQTAPLSSLRLQE